MAKAKLASLTAKWIDGGAENRNAIKAERRNNRMTERHKDGKTERQKIDDGKVKQTLYISQKAVKLLWQNRVETGETISHAIERVVMKNLGKEE